MDYTRRFYHARIVAKCVERDAIQAILAKSLFVRISYLKMVIPDPSKWILIETTRNAHHSAPALRPITITEDEPQELLKWAPSIQW